jgi:hypothetical protein
MATLLKVFDTGGIMEKFAVQEDDLLSGLRDEEHNLMLEVSSQMSGYKSADGGGGFLAAQSRLQAVRDKITELDLAKSKKS